MGASCKRRPASTIERVCPADLPNWAAIPHAAATVRATIIDIASGVSLPDGNGGSQSVKVEVPHGNLSARTCAGALSEKIVAVFDVEQIGAIGAV